MIIEDKIGIRDYKCFTRPSQGFNRILPLNIIIGKNNSGKSSLLDIIGFITQGDETESLSPNIIIKHQFTAEDFDRSGISRGTYALGNGTSDFKYLKEKYVGLEVVCRWNRLSGFDLEELPFSVSSQERNLVSNYAKGITLPLGEKKFCKITAERDIVQEYSEKKIKFLPNGEGVTNSIVKILNNVRYDSMLIEKVLLDGFNAIVNPDVLVKRILVQEDSDNYWEVFFEDENHNRIALSKMGSGVKTILIVLMNLLVRPKIENNSVDNYIFAFEELENNLHPALQRRLYEYIMEYSEKNRAYFFLTTHSNIVIDCFSNNHNSQILHVQNKGSRSVVKTISSYNGERALLCDLGIKASDILQSNGIVWVEGPSDRNYVNRWINLIDSSLKEGLHYSIMFYGGRSLANVTFDTNWLNKDIIPLLKINQNAYVVIDRDGLSDEATINKTKKRVKEEIGAESCWVTEGREIENYLSKEILENWLLNTHSIEESIKLNKNKKLEDIINSTDLKYNLKKNKYSSEITTFINKDSIDILDLRENIERLVNEIKKWNQMS